MIKIPPETPVKPVPVLPVVIPEERAVGVTQFREADWIYFNFDCICNPGRATPSHMYRECSCTDSILCAVAPVERQVAAS